MRVTRSIPRPHRIFLTDAQGTITLQCCHHWCIGSWFSFSASCLTLLPFEYPVSHPSPLWLLHTPVSSSSMAILSSAILASFPCSQPSSDFSSHRGPPGWSSCHFLLRRKGWAPPSAHSVRALPSLFLTHIQHPCTSEPLYLLLSLPWMVFPRVFHFSALLLHAGLYKMSPP